MWPQRLMNPELYSARAFFGRRKGHKLRPRQAELFDTVLPRLALELERPAPAELRTLFPVPVSEVRLEIGFGGGENMLAQARARPLTGFIGVEPFVNGMAKALAAIEAADLQNIRLHFDDATSLLAWLPDASLARIELIHPDPWPKRRHWKRRFVQDAAIKRRRFSLCHRHQRLHVMDAAALPAIFRFRMDRATRRRLAKGLAGFRRHPLPRQSGA
jgi:tRNA (guanine-N7-)-methyltransferase